MAIRSFKSTTPTLHARAWVDESAVVIGDVVLEEDVSIWPMVVIRGDVNFIRIGKRSNVQDGSVLHVASRTKTVPDGFSLMIGDDVTVGHKAMLHGCQIGDRCLIGMGATVMDGAVIEDEVLLAAGSLVSPGKRLTSGSVYQGRPARRVRDLSREEIDGYLVGTARYVELKQLYQT